MSEVGSMETGKADDKCKCGHPSSVHVDEVGPCHNPQACFCEQYRHNVPADEFQAELAKTTNPSPDKWDALRKADDEEAERFANAFIEVVNADHDDMITINRDIGCRIRDHIENLRRELRGMERGGEGQIDKPPSLKEGETGLEDIWRSRAHWIDYARKLEAKLATLSVTEGVDGREICDTK